MDQRERKQKGASTGPLYHSRILIINHPPTHTTPNGAHLGSVGRAHAALAETPPVKLGKPGVPPDLRGALGPQPPQRLLAQQAAYQVLELLARSKCG